MATDADVDAHDKRLPGVSNPSAYDEAFGIESKTAEQNEDRTEINMTEALIEAAACEESVLSALRHLRNGNIEGAVAEFAEEFCFNDRALGLEFTGREQLREFFQKERELYPDASFRIKKILSVEEHAVVEWQMEYTIKEPFYGSTLRKAPVLVQGVSIARTREGKITDWSDYYDGLVSRRSALASYFIEWIEY
jgi:steroid delta-isomerase-like uncharacterized protein